MRTLANNAFIVIAVLVSFTSIETSCKKNSNPFPGGGNTDSTRNGINFRIATKTINSYRDSGYQSFPPVNDLTWNDTLSDAAYHFAHDKAADTGNSGSVYSLSTGQFLADYPALLGFK